MKFQFDVKINEQDYLDYNVFWQIKSHYGKKQIKTYRIILAVIPAIFILISLIGGGFTVDSVLGNIPMVIVSLLVQIFLNKIFYWSIKSHIKALKKSGKMGYSPESGIEFYEDCFVEITTENKSENKYSIIERISIVENKMIYIHVNNIMSYLLPMSCFESNEQYKDFISFIKTKCENIDVY